MPALRAVGRVAACARIGERRAARSNPRGLQDALIDPCRVCDVCSGDEQWKHRIAIHAALDGPSRFGVLCHELAHIYLGHLGSDADHWWPSRTNLTKNAVELEAEAVAFLVTLRLGLQGSSSAYVSRHMPDGNVPQGASMDLIAKVAGRIEQMTKERLPRRARRDAARRQS